MRFAPEAWPFVLPFWFVAAVLAVLGHPAWAAALLVLGGLILLFFRDPGRRWQGDDPDVLLAPAFGLVTTVDTISEPALGSAPVQRVVTFLSVFDVHLQRVPADGEVVSSTARPGKYVPAWDAHADEINAGHLSILRRANGDLIGVRQVVGLVARRIVCYLRPTQRVSRGETMGLIKFGSRVDILVPTGYEILVKKGDRVQGGITPIAHGRRP
jgi:phosphatidylserine decarboxylase